MKKSELIKIIKEELTSILSEQNKVKPKIIYDELGMPGIDTGKRVLADAQTASRTLVNDLTTHLQTNDIKYAGTHFKQSKQGTWVLLAYRASAPKKYLGPTGPT